MSKAQLKEQSLKTPTWMCPRCRGATRRSSPRLKDRLFKLLGIIPLRCDGCNYRFYTHTIRRPKRR